MISHVVLFKLKSFSAEEKKEKLVEFKKRLLELEDIIEEIKYTEVGTNHELEGKSFDLCLITHFSSINDLEAYKIHPEHLKLVEFANQIIDERTFVDYRF